MPKENMKKITLFSVLILVLLNACSQGQPATTNPSAELVEVKFDAQAGESQIYIDGTTVVHIPAGEFIMGVANGVDNPEHKVYTNGFWIYSTEVTNNQYALCAASGTCTLPTENNNLNYTKSFFNSHPVSGVTYEQAQTYCQWINGRLPTEAEWEKTARSPQSAIYPWGNDEPSCNFTNFGDCQGNSTDTVATHPDGQTQYKIHDLSGNVFEWVFDWFAYDYYSNSPLENPTGPANGEMRVIRGGSYVSTTQEITSFTRSQSNPAEDRNDLGFRCVVEDIRYFAPMCEVAASLPPGSADDAFFDCPVVDWKKSAYCSHGKPYINFEITPADAGYDVHSGSSCQDQMQNGSLLVTCTGPEFSEVILDVAKKCSVIGLLDCSEGYTYDENTSSCVIDKNILDELSGNNCQEGFQFDTENQCCNASPTAETYPKLCPPGQVYNDWNAACFPADTLFMGGGLAKGNLLGCTDELQGDPSACKLTAKDCPHGIDVPSCSCNPAPG